MKIVYLSLLISSYLFLTGCSFSQEKRNTETIEEDSIDIKEDKDEVIHWDSNLVNYENLEIGKLYTDTVVFNQYMHVGDFERIRVTKNDKNLFPLYDKNDTLLNRGDLAILTWTVDSIWIPEAPNEKWLSPIVQNITKIKDGKLSLYKKEYPQPITYYYDKSIKDNYLKEDFDEIYSLVLYYLANTDKPLVNQSDSVQIQYSIEERSRVEGEAVGTYITKYIVIGLSNYFENHNSISQWLYLKRNNQGYMDIYEYDLPNDQLILFK